MIQKTIDKHYIKGKGLPLSNMQHSRSNKIRPRSTGKYVRATCRYMTMASWFYILKLDVNHGVHWCFSYCKATMSYMWYFLCWQKSTPVDLCLIFFIYLWRQVLPECQLRSDEDSDSALIGNTKFCTIMYKVLGIVLDSTGGRRSTSSNHQEVYLRKSYVSASAQPIMVLCRSILSTDLQSVHHSCHWQTSGTCLQ